jgi:uncharacterized membrane protein HdeD (DUF308 family)
MAKKNKTVLGAIGVILLIFGVIFTPALAIKGGVYNYGLIVTLFLVIMGVILIAKAFND